MSCPASQQVRGQSKLAGGCNDRGLGGRMQGGKRTQIKEDSEAQMAGREGRSGGKRRQDEVEVDGLHVFRLLHQQKPVGGEKSAVMRAAAVDALAHTKQKQSSSHLAAHSSSSNPHIFTNIITLTLTLEGLQHGGISGAQPGGVAS